MNSVTDIAFARKVADALDAYEDSHRGRALRVLKREHRMCAIGVACDLLREEDPDRFSWRRNVGNKTYDFVDRLSHTSYTVTVPAPVSSRIGNDLAFEMMRMSDDRKSFRSIARLIRSRIGQEHL